MINALEVYRRLKGEYDKTDQPLRERSSILPFGQYEDGSVGLAWPEIPAGMEASDTDPALLEYLKLYGL